MRSTLGAVTLGLGLTLSAIQAMAASRPETLPYTIDGNQGLPQNSVRTVLVDHQNFVWVGTERGLARYDGHRFVNFSEEHDDIPVDVLISLFEDSHGRIWTNWFKSGPRVLMPDREEVIELLPAVSRGTDRDEGVSRIWEDGEGRVWFGGRHALYRMDPDGTVVSAPLSGTGSGWPQGSGNTVYAGGYEGLHHVDLTAEPPRVRFHPLPPHPGFRHRERHGRARKLLEWRGNAVVCAPWGIFLANGPPGSLRPLYRVNQFLIENCTLLGSQLYLTRRRDEPQEHEIVALDLESEQLLRPPRGLPARGFASNGFVDSRGGQWIVVQNELYVRSPDADAFRHAELRAPIFSLEQAIAESRNGEVWVATDGSGLAVFARHRRKFETVVPPDPGGDVTSPQVRGISHTRPDSVWVATEERGINRWNRARGDWHQYLADSPAPFKELVSLQDGSVWAVDEYRRCLLRFDESNDRWIEEFKLDGSAGKLAPLDGRRLLLATGAGIYRYDPSSGEKRRLNRDDIPSRVRAMTVDDKGDIWFGMHEWGLMRLSADGESRQWTVANSGLSSDQLFALLFDRDGKLWIGTWHGGLQRFDPETETFEHFGVDDGLPDDTVFGILQDNAGDLWFSTYRGLVRLRPCDDPACTPDIRVFNRFDGLQGMEFDAESFFRSTDGELFFGGSGGFNAFYPGDIRLNDKAPETVISRLSLNGAPLPGERSMFVAPSRLTLQNGFGTLRIELSSLDYNAPQKNRYQFRDRRDGEGWTPLDGPELVLHGLPEGRHALEFRGSNNDGFWSRHPLRLDVAVNPPWYRHPGVLLTWGALLLVAPLLFFLQRQARLVGQREQLEQQVNERTRELRRVSSARERFFANISHEIAAPLHMILLMLEQRRREGSDDGLYRSATGYAAQLLSYLRQLVDGAHSLEADSRLYRADVVATVTALAELNREVAAGRHISLRVDELPAASVKVYRHTPASILSNLLCNALMYTPEHGEVRISGRIAGGRYRITVGNTLHPDHPVEIEQAMDRGRRGRFDATAFGGHGLGLSIVTESAESLGGSVQRRTRDGWVVFQVELPLADDSLPPLPEAAGIELSPEQRKAIESIEDRPGPAKEKHAGMPGGRVLIIEDDQNVSTLLAGILGDQFDVRTANSSREGIHIAREWLPGVILCDLFLPDQSGFEVVRAVRANRMTQDSLLVMITASISESDRLQGMRLGVDQFIRKPVSAETIRWIIHNHMSLARQRQGHLRTEQLRRQAHHSRHGTNGLDAGTHVRAALESLYGDPSTTVEDLQTLLSMSYPALVKTCRRHFGKTPKRLLVEKRIEKASVLLLQSDHKIGMIAELAGFSSHAQFATTFRKETGMTPAEYRRAESGHPGD